MDIRSYLQKKGLSQEDFAKQLDVSQGLVWQWLNGRTKVSPEQAKKIEARTKGQIKRHELRPDIWERAA